MNRSFIPALRLGFLTPLYDAILAATGFGARFRSFELGLVVGEVPRAILEVGCGTGELLAAAGRRFPGARLVGLDPDPKALGLARKKFEALGRTVELVQGVAQDLPFGDGSFDLLLSSLMFHHLATPDKVKALAEWRRVLVQGGTLLLVDLGPPCSRLLRLLTWPARWNVVEWQGDNLRGLVPGMLAEAGFAGEEVGRYRDLFVAWRARREG